MEAGSMFNSFVPLCLCASVPSRLGEIQFLIGAKSVGIQNPLFTLHSSLFTLPWVRYRLEILPVD